MKEVKKQADIQLVKVVGHVITHEETAIAASFRHTTIDTVVKAICGENKNRNSLILKNLSVDTIWIGDRHLIPGTTGTGYPLTTGEAVTLDKNIGEIFASTEANSSIISIIEE